MPSSAGSTIWIAPGSEAIRKTDAITLLQRLLLVIHGGPACYLGSLGGSRAADHSCFMHAALA
jgi:hypothetical protein